MFVRDGEHDGSARSFALDAHLHTRTHGRVDIFSFFSLQTHQWPRYFAKCFILSRQHRNAAGNATKRGGSRPGHCVLVTIKDPSKNYTVLEGNKFFIFLFFFFLEFIYSSSFFIARENSQFRRNWGENSVIRVFESMDVKLRNSVLGHLFPKKCLNQEVWKKIDQD